ncbi:Flagellar hook-basal body complex protein FliE [hydrothermal vent metagenome]|uniref:Flagellar hook-basal body complex protein FliE n=1 Tax=hydrothermal vent metagenome TaxID=652676 RepID=A0A3B0Z5X1_9ZZZZ
MSDMNINQVLAQMRTLAAQAEAAPQGVNASSDTQLKFSEVLKSSLDQVNAVSKEASALSKAFEAGDPDVDITQVMVGLQKASVSFQAMTQVRNKLLTAYQDIMNMPI